MRWKKRRSLSILIILLSFMSDSSDATRRHRREGDAKESTVSKKKKKEDTCVYGYCLDPSYNSLELPSKVTATHIKMNLEVLDVLRVDDKNFRVSLSMYFGVHWTEDRLKLPSLESNFSAANWLPIDLDFMKNLWIPNVFVYNLNSFTALDCLKKLAGLWIVKDKDLFYNQATHVTFMCPMRFNKFPLDEHSCKFVVGSTNYDDTRMTFANDKLEYDPSAGNTILDYQVLIVPIKKEDSIVPYGESGNYSVTGFEMILTRNVAKYLYIYYLPSGLFVVVSWTSFLIPPEVVPGRMALLVTLFLVLINIFNTINNASPNVEGMTAISAWMLACMFFIFGALLGYACILYFLLSKKKLQMNKKRASLTVIHAKDCFLYQGSEVNKRKEEISSVKQAQNLAKVDSFFFYLFPFMFFIFNIIYWPYWTIG